MQKTKIRILTDSDKEAIASIGEYFTKEVNGLLKVKDFGLVWGLFLENELIGYCKISRADLYTQIKNHPLCTSDSLLLSDLCIREEYRCRGYAILLAKESMDRSCQEEIPSVYVLLPNPSLYPVFDSMGFYSAFVNRETVMVRKARRRPAPELRVIIAGSRDFTDYPLLEEKVTEILKEKKQEYPLASVAIVSGNARGADLLGEQYAEKYGYPLVRFPADWNLFRSQAGPIRNQHMAEFASERTGILIAFWDSVSKGTANMIQTAKTAGLDVYVIRY